MIILKFRLDFNSRNVYIVYIRIYNIVTTNHIVFSRLTFESGLFVFELSKSGQNNIIIIFFKQDQDSKIFRETPPQIPGYPLNVVYIVNFMHLLYLFCGSVPAETVTPARRIMRPRYHSNTDPAAVTTWDCRCLPPARYRDRTTSRGLCRPCRTRSKSSTCRCSVRKRTCG